MEFNNYNDLTFFLSLIPENVYKKYLNIIIKKQLLEFTNLNKDECPITLMKYRKGYITLCNHSFSKTGLDKWLKNNFTCPICRRNLFNYTEIQ